MNEKEKTREDPLLALVYVKGGDVHGIFRETQWMSVYQNLDSPCLWGNQPHDIIEIKVPLWENMEVYLIFTKNLSQSIQNLSTKRLLKVVFLFIKSWKFYNVS